MFAQALFAHKAAQYSDELSGVVHKVFAPPTSMSNLDLNFGFTTIEFTMSLTLLSVLVSSTNPFSLIYNTLVATLVPTSYQNSFLITELFTTYVVSKYGSDSHIVQIGVNVHILYFNFRRKF